MLKKTSNDKLKTHASPSKHEDKPTTHPSSPTMQLSAGKVKSPGSLMTEREMGGAATTSLGSPVKRASSPTKREEAKSGEKNKSPWKLKPGTLIKGEQDE